MYWIFPFFLIFASLFAEDKFASSIRFNPDGENLVGRIVIDDRSQGINQGTWLYVKNALESFRKTRPIFISLELNTPGGEVFSAEEISNALKEMDIQYGIPCVAFVNNWALSAGALLAYSCRIIATVKDGAMGAAEPIIQEGAGEAKTASEKINSAIRADFASRALFFNRNPLIAEAMVDKDLILVKRGAEILKLNQESEIITSGPSPDIVISPKGKLLTLTGPDLIKLGVADVLVEPTRVEPLSEQEKQTGNFSGKQYILFTAPFFSDIPNVRIMTYNMDAKTRFFVFLASPAVQSVLFLAMMIGFYMELSNPGLTLPGGLALFSLFFILLSSFSQEIAGMIEVIFLATGVLILLFDLFVMPTFGILGSVGVLFFFIGLIGIMVPGLDKVSFEYDTHTWNSAGEFFLQRLSYLAVTFLVGLGICGFLSRYLPQFGPFQRFVLIGNEQVGFTATATASELPKVGEQGVVISSLRPSGKVEIAGSLYDSSSRGFFIEAGKKVEVVGSDGGTLFVREIQDG